MTVYDFDKLLSQKIPQGEWVVQHKIKVLLTYTVYPLAMGTYFKKALQNREDVDLRVAGVYTGSWIPWMGGMSLPEKYAIPPDVALPLTLGTTEYNYELVKVMLGGWTPDLIIQCDSWFHAKHRPTDGYVATVAIDPHAIPVDFYDVPRKYSDKFFNMQKVYSQPGDIYLPYAYSKYDFYPENDRFDSLSSTGFSPIEKDLDAVLVGMPYEQRVQWINELKRHGVKAHMENGPVFDEARALYNRARIGLNWSSLDDLNCRAFELPAMMLYPVMNWVTDLGDFDFSNHIGIFRDLGSAVDEVLWAMEHPEEASEQARLAYYDVLPHTYDARVETILKESGFIS